MPVGSKAETAGPVAEMSPGCLFTNQTAAWHGLPWQPGCLHAKIKEEAGKGGIPPVLGRSHWFGSMHHHGAAGVVASTQPARLQHHVVRWVGARQ